MITLIELTKEYSILANGTGGAIEFALAASFLYMMMSLPLCPGSRGGQRGGWGYPREKGARWYEHDRGE